MATDPNVADIVSAVAAVISAVGGAFAALAAFRSASHAKQSSLHAEDVERRLVARQLVGIAHSTLADANLANVLAESYLGELAAHEVFTGNRGPQTSGAEIRQKLDSRLKELDAIRPDIEKIVNEHHFVTSASLNDLTGRLAVLERHAAQARVVTEDLTRRLREIVERNRPYRNRVTR